NDMGNQGPITIDWLSEIFFQLTHEIVEKKGEGVTWDEFPKEEFIKAITDRMKNEGLDEQSKQLAKEIIQYCELRPREIVSKGSLNLKTAVLDVLVYWYPKLSIYEPIGVFIYPHLRISDFGQKIEIKSYDIDEHLLDNLIADGWIGEDDEATRTLVRKL